MKKATKNTDNVVVEQEKKVAYETLSSKNAVEALQTSKENGLSCEEAKERLNRYGENKLQEKKKKSWISIFFSQMNNPMIFVLFAAIAVTVGVSLYDTIQVLQAGNSFDFFKVGDWPDCIIILAVIIMNSVIGTVQEVKAQTSLEALKKMSSPESTVIRDGKRFKVKATELVPGDIVILEEGDTVGADLRLIEAINLKTNESSLTGESVPVEKDAELVFSKEVGIGDRINLAYSATVVTYGRGMGVVIATGMKTEIGKIAHALDNEVDTQTPLQQKLAQLSKILGILTIIIVICVFIVDVIWLFIHGLGYSFGDYIDPILSSISLAVAAVPEGLPAVVTIVLAIGVQRMVKANTIVRKLPSVETLGAVSVVCSDKTGTLTQNKMTVVEAYINNEYFENNVFNDKANDSLKLLARGLSLCSNATVDEGLYGDPTEIALVVFANELGMHKKDLENATPRINELPFDSVRKMMSTMHDDNGKKLIYTKGALDSILAHTDMILINGKARKITDKDIEDIYGANKHYANKALRVLALAIRENDNIEEEHLTFVGLVASIDPARPEAKPAVAMFKHAGITTVMITGDHKDTAFAIAKDLGIADSAEQCLTGADVDKLTFDELKETCKNARVFARVSPENKVSIVKAFEANGNICAMTGDGVNDAPSLKAADIGIAMGITGTDVAKGAADMVLTDDNFASIEKAVEEGRGIYANIKKTVIFLLSSNIAEVFAMFIIICIGFPAPLIAIHLLWVNLVTDSLPAIALGMDPKDPHNMNDKPRSISESLFSHGGYAATLGYGAVITVATLLAFFSRAWLDGIFSFQDIFNLYTTNSEALLHAQTMAFTTLACSELFHMLGVSDLNHSFVHIFKSKNWMMLIAFASGILLQLFVVETPGVQLLFSTHGFDGPEWLVTIALSIMPLVVHEIIVFIKWCHNKAKGNKNNGTI